MIYDTVYVAGTRENLLRELDRVRRELESGGGEASIYARANLGEADVTVTFSNDDMEDRPEVADVILVDVV